MGRWSGVIVIAACLAGGCGLILDLDPVDRETVGPVDAGGPRDAGNLDAGTSDSGPRDAGRTDAGGEEDAGPDAGPSPGEAVAVAAGTLHTCALLADDRVACWGQNTDGQVGVGTVGSRVAPSVVPSLAGVVGLDAAFQHSCAFLGDGRAYCWGSATDGRVGTGATGGIAPSPTGVVGLADIESIATGTYHSCAARSDGQYACWGRGAEGQLGSGGGSGSPTPLSGYAASEIVEVTAGQSHSCGLGDDRRAFCWGSGSLGQLGDGTTLSSALPKTVELSDVVQIDAGDHHTCARTNDGAVYCFGNNGDGRVSPSAAGATLVSTPTRAGDGRSVDVSAGGKHSCSVLDTGEVVCWGANGFGQLGGEPSDPDRPIVFVEGLHDVVDVSCGAQHTCVVHDTGQVSCWGSNAGGQLGVPSPGESLSPIPVPLP